MTTQKNQFEYYVPYELDELESLRIVETTNKVLIQIFPEDAEETVGGIYTKGIKPFGFAKNTTRRAKVIKTCERIVPGKTEAEFTLWQTDVQVKPGDEIYINYFDNLNSYDFTYQDMDIKLIPYIGIICAIRDGEVIMCNGYVLLEDYEESVGFGEHKFERKIADQGIVRHIGKPNKRYYIPVVKHTRASKIREGRIGSVIYGRSDLEYICEDRWKHDHEEGELQDGDRVVIGDVRKVWYLEEWSYARFDKRKMYRVCQQYNIIAKFI